MAARAATDVAIGGGREASECWFLRRSFAGYGLATAAAMFTILIILLVLALIGGGVGHSRFGYAGWSPAGLLILVLVVLMLTGNRL